MNVGIFECKATFKYVLSQGKKALTFVLSSLLLYTATVLEGLFGEYHSSSAALGQQRPKVTKQPLTCDWSATSEALCDVNRRFARNTEVKFVQGVNTMTVKDFFLASFCALRGTGRHCLCLRPSWDQMAARTTTVDVSCT